MSAELAKLLLISDARGESREAMAATLGIGVELFESLVEQFETLNGEGAWQEEVATKRAESTVIASDWDSLEGLVVAKLVKMANNDRITGVGDLLAVARVANSAQRRGGIFPNQNAPQSSGEFSASLRLPGGAEGMITMRLTPEVARSAELDSLRRFGGAPITTKYQAITTPSELREIADLAAVKTEESVDE